MNHPTTNKPLFLHHSNKLFKPKMNTLIFFTTLLSAPFSHHNLFTTSSSIAPSSPMISRQLYIYKQLVTKIFLSPNNNNKNSVSVSVSSSSLISLITRSITIKMQSSDNNDEVVQQKRLQHVIVMRHGDRIDNFEPLWITTAERPWDPPLVDTGKVRAFCTGRKLRNNLGFPINRVIVSPFIRCIETASQVVSALSALQDDPLEMTKDNVSVDSSKVKVSIEYGLCEILSREAIRPDFAPKNEQWGFNISELEAKFPDGMVDRTFERVYPEMPRWEETLADARVRYARVFKALADKFPSENLLLVTHGEGVGVAVTAFLENTLVHEVEYCAYSHLQRQITISSTQTFDAKNFQVVTNNGETGIRFCPLNPVIR